MISIRKAGDRGYVRQGWLESWHSFSFGSYYDPNFMGFSKLRVINDDRIEPGKGFGSHPHKDMEILTYVLSGTVAHKDNMGNEALIPAGEFQLMSAGTGVQHSEFNPDTNEQLHLYQIWILPEKDGITPRYEQRRFSRAEHQQLILSPDGRDGSLVINQNMTLTRLLLVPGQSAQLDIAEKRSVWLQVVKGQVTLPGFNLQSSDAAAITNESLITLEAETESEILVFDLPHVY